KVISQKVADYLLHQLFQLVCRNTPSVAARGGAMHQALRDVVAITLTVLVGMGRAQPIPGFVVSQTGQEAGRLAVGRRLPVCGIIHQLTLNGVECRPVDDGIVPAGVPYTLVDYLADIDRVGQQLMEMASGEGVAPAQTARRWLALLGY